MCGGQTVTTQQHIRIDIPRGVLNGRTTAGKTTSDQTLIERIAVGDKLAMRVLFARHHVRVYRFVVRLVRDETLAEDVVGEMFLDVWRQAATFKARAAVSTWLLAIARFKALSLLRRKGEEALDEEPCARSRTPPTTRSLQCGRRSEVKSSAGAGRNRRQNIGTSSISLLSGESDRRGRRDNRNPREHREDAHVSMREASGRSCSKCAGLDRQGDALTRCASTAGVEVVNRKLRGWCTAHKSVAAKAQCRPITRRQGLGPTYAGTNDQIGCCQFKCSGGLFSEHWIDGQRCGPLPRRHSGKGRAVPKRCPSISAFFAPFGAARSPRRLIASCALSR